MKLLYFIVGVVLAFHVYSDEEKNELQRPYQDKNITYLMEKEPIEEVTSTVITNALEFRFLMYGQMEVAMPSAGMAFRARFLGFGVEGNFTLIASPAWKTSACLLSYFGEPFEKKWYLGLGLGRFEELAEKKAITAYIPLFFGYEGERWFGDLGLDTLLPNSEKKAFYAPTVRLGLCF